MPDSYSRINRGCRQSPGCGHPGPPRQVPLHPGGVRLACRSRVGSHCTLADLPFPKAIDSALTKGTTFQDFKKRFGELAEEH